MAQTPAKRIEELKVERTALGLALKALDDAKLSVTESYTSIYKQYNIVDFEIMNLQYALDLENDTAEPEIYRTEDGYIFFRQPDGSYTDGRYGQNDIKYNSFADLTA